MTGLAIETQQPRQAVRDSTGHSATARSTIPTGRISGLVGANGAGKTTLHALARGTESSDNAGAQPWRAQVPADNIEFLREIGYLAQEVPLYRRWNANDHLELGAAYERRCGTTPFARERLRSLNIPLDRRIESLSGGMRAQVALALALGKRPRVLLLDEPVAALDPFAAREFLASLAGAVAEDDMTALLSSHLLPDLERVCDHLVLLADGAPHRVRDIDELVA